MNFGPIRFKGIKNIPLEAGEKTRGHLVPSSLWKKLLSVTFWFLKSVLGTPLCGISRTAFERFFSLKMTKSAKHHIWRFWLVLVTGMQLWAPKIIFRAILNSYQLIYKTIILQMHSISVSQILACTTLTSATRNHTFSLKSWLSVLRLGTLNPL